MRYAQFYALAIFFMYRLYPRKVSSSWSVSLYMIFSFVSSGDSKAINLHVEKENCKDRSVESNVGVGFIPILI